MLTGSTLVTIGPARCAAGAAARVMQAPGVLPSSVAVAWGLQCFAMIFAVPVPGVGLATTTLFAIPCVLYAFGRLGVFSRRILVSLLVFLVIGVMLGGLVGGNLEGVYLNFLFWMINAYSSFAFLCHEQGREIALRCWAWAVGVLVLVRSVEIFMGAEVGLWDRNGYGFFLSVFSGALYYEVSRRQSRPVGLACLFVLLVVLVLNGSRSGVLTGLLVACVLYMLAAKRPRGKPLRVLGLGASAFSLGVSLYFLEGYSPVFEGQFEWLREYSLSRDERVLYEGGGGTIGVRGYMAEKSLQLFRARPVTGVGLFRWSRVFDVEVQAVLDGLHFRVLVEHNSYLLWLAETGLMGSIPFVLLFVFLLRESKRCWSLFGKTREPKFLVGACITCAVLFQFFFLGIVTASGTWSILMTAPAFVWGHGLRLAR